MDGERSSNDQNGSLRVRFKVSFQVSKRGQQTIPEPSKKESGSTDTEDDDDDFLEECACDVDEDCLIAIRESVTAETGLIHPILYDVYDGCKFAKEEKLLTFKVKMLRELCHVLSVQSKHEIKKQIS